MNWQKIFALYITEKEFTYIKSPYKAIRKRLVPLQRKLRIFILLDNSTTGISNPSELITLHNFLLPCRQFSFSFFPPAGICGPPLFQRQRVFSDSYYLSFLIHINSGSLRHFCIPHFVSTATTVIWLFSSLMLDASASFRQISLLPVSPWTNPPSKSAKSIFPKYKSDSLKICPP